MQDVKYVCQNCTYEAVKPGTCPKCQAPMVASCAVCGNPVVGEHVSAD